MKTEQVKANRKSVVESLAGNLLIASPSMDDERFAHAVVLLCAHNDEGAFGLIINKILMSSFSTLLADFEISESIIDTPVFYGGPVSPEYGYVIYTPFNKRYGAMRVNSEIAVSSSRAILQDISSGKGPGRHLFALGFAGWGPGQLEQELMGDFWLVAPVDPDLLFRVPTMERWRHAARLIGVDFERYCDRPGHA